jgi:hypothetical protein
VDDAKSSGSIIDIDIFSFSERGSAVSNRSGTSCRCSYCHPNASTTSGERVALEEEEDLLEKEEAVKDAISAEEEVVTGQ